MNSRWMITAAVLVGFVAAATIGCVPKDQYDKAVAASRRANEALLSSQSDLQTARAENRKLMDDLAARDAALTGKDKILASLQEANKDLTDNLVRLKALYDRAIQQRPVPDFGPLPPKVDTALQALAGENPELMEYVSKYGMIKLKADLTFGKGSAKVKAGAAEALGKLAAIVNTDEAKMFHVYAAGHTDDIPLVRPETIAAHGSNWGLSLHRAGAVVKVLATAGVAQRRMGAVGFSKYHPVAHNAPGNKGNPLNRRVEIWIVPPERFLTASGVVQPEK